MPHRPDHPCSTIKRILIVDDEVEFANSLTRHLKRQGFDLYIAHDGLEALAQLKTGVRAQSPIDLVISDVIMPNMDGLQLLHSIKASHPATSVILLTGFGENPIARAVIREKLDNFHQKPIKPHQMLALIQGIDEKRTSARQREASGSYTGEKVFR